MKRQKNNIKDGHVDRIKYFEIGYGEALDSISDYEYQIILDYMCWQGIQFDDKSVLVLGCGNGYLEEKIQKNFRIKNLTLLDASKECLKHAKKRCSNAQIICMDLLLFDSARVGVFDLIYSVNVMQYLDEQSVINLHNELIKCLSPNGMIYHMGIPDYSRKWLYRIDQTVIHRDMNFLLGRKDFIDDYSKWHKRKTFANDKYKVWFSTPSLRYERFDVKIHHKLNT